MNLEEILQSLKENSYCHIHDFNKLAKFDDAEKKQFKSYWNRLVLDRNFEEYTYRERRILRYFYTPKKPLCLNPNSHYDSAVVYDIEYKQERNHLTYVESDFVHNSLMRQVLATDIKIFEESLDEARTYAIDIHLFRVRAESGAVSPTTSGIHQDGMDFICMHFIDADNVQPVVSKLYTKKESESMIFTKTMNNFLETLVVDDAKLYHSASEVRQLIQNKVAYRDLLLVTFHALDK